jgi:enoyl-CoA hydratase
LTTQALTYQKQNNGVAIITINDAPLNRMTLAFINDLESLIEQIAVDDEVRAFVITAQGTDNFSVGMNLKELQTGVSAAGGIDAFFVQGVNLISRFETMGSPDATEGIMSFLEKRKPVFNQ